MTIDILHQHTNTLPSGFKITFTVGRIVKDNPHSLPVPPKAQAADPALVDPSLQAPAHPTGEQP